MKTYCPHCGALNEHGLTKPKDCVKCKKTLELSPAPATHALPQTVAKATRPLRADPRISNVREETFDDDDDDDDAEIPENISCIEIEPSRASRPSKIKIGDLAGKGGYGEPEREIKKVSRKKQLQELRDESRSAREKSNQNIE